MPRGAHAVLALAWMACSPDLPAQAAPVERRLVLAGVSVIDVRAGRLLGAQTVVIERDRIAAVLPAGEFKTTSSDRVVDAEGAFLIPGLWDMHAHSLAAAEREFPVHLALGVTGIRNMHSTVDTALELVAALKRRLARGGLVGPRLVANGPVLDGPQPVHRGSARAGSAEQARRVVDSLVDGGADFIKTYIRLPRAAYFAAADQARRRGVPLVGHLPIGVRAEEAVRAGQRSFEHGHVLDWHCSLKGDSVLAAFLADTAPDRMTYLRARGALTLSWDAGHCAPAIEALRRAGAWVVPTLVVGWAPVAAGRVLDDREAIATVSRATVEEWRAADAELPPEARRVFAAEVRTSRELVGLLYRAGVPILAGTDVGNPFTMPGYSLHTELELLVGAGLTPLAALRAATLNPARFLEATDSLGTVERGKLADLVLLEKNPLEGIRNTRRIRAVIANGRYFARSTLDSILRAARPQPGAGPVSR